MKWEWEVDEHGCVIQHQHKVEGEVEGKASKEAGRPWTSEMLPKLEAEMGGIDTRRTRGML